MHNANTFDASVVRVSAWKADQLTDLNVELTNLLTLMEHPQQRSFTIEDRQLQRTDVLYTAKELGRLRELARSLGGRDPDFRFEDRLEAKRVAAARTTFLKRGAILHTDIARDVSRTPENREGHSRSGTPPAVLKFYDGQILGVDRSSDHWDFARNLLDLVAPARDQTVRLWYRATLAWMLGAMQLQSAHFQRAKEVYPDDAALLYLRGCFHETLASPRVQEIVSAISAVSQRNPVRSARAELRDAETYLQRALSIDPALTDARLRLGRVQFLLGKNNSAVAELKRALSASNDAASQYYGNLFIGSALEAIGAREEAQAAYERASKHFPDADAPPLALSQLAVGSTDRDSVLGALEPLLRRGGRSGGEDPWSRYYVAAGSDAEARLAAAYEALLNGDTR